MRTPAERYDPVEVEARWQRTWAERRVFSADLHPDRPKDYILEMFPYPSGALHMGHARVYSIGDVLARVSRMQGRAVLHPMGYDSLGLPAENAAIKDGIHPRIRTARNTESFRAEMVRMGFSFDWSRELTTSDPGYYRWNQWFFLRMLERDLVYRRRGLVNWCPTCATVLANEQVDAGVCWRGHSGVTQKRIGEWAFRITRYADDLLAGLSELTAWPERITSMQRNWIGRSVGAEIAFPVVGRAFPVRVFTTRVDTIYGCTYLVIAPEHPLTEQLVSARQKAAVAAFAEKMLRSDRVARTSTTAEKEGVDTGAFATNPFTGEQVPIWVANFVLADYGTGAVMSVPAHDARDFAFAKKYALPIKVVVRPAPGAKGADRELEEAFTSYGVGETGGPASGLPAAEVRQRLIAEAEAKGFGKARVTYQIRDWGFSRQRYWGTPIPVVYCPHEGTAEDPKVIPVPDSQLPLVLPENVELTGQGAPPLAKLKDFIEVSCPSCGKPARRESDTMDTFVDSSWYFARFLDPHNDREPFGAAVAKRWLPVDTYIGGPEHAVLHLLYFRFWTRVMNELGLCDVKEPARRLITQGIVLGNDGEKMSKSAGNVVSPGPYLDRYGADALRLFVLFAGPVDHDFAWSDSQVDGLFRFLTRIWRFFGRFHGEIVAAKPNESLPGEGTPRARSLRQLSHRTLKRVTDDIERVHFNTAIAALMEQLNGLSAAMGPEDKPLPVVDDSERAALREAFEVQATCLSPFAPHLAEELWSLLGHERTLPESAWLKFDPALVVAESLVYAVQVNGKLRAEVEVSASAGEAEVVAAAKADAKVLSHLEGKTLRKTIFVPKRLVNFVVG